MGGAGDRGRPPAVPADADIDAFLAEARELAPPRGAASGRLIFALDATMSREPTWDRAAAVQAGMFAEAEAAGGLAIQLAWFRGIGEFRAGPWTRSAADLRRAMTGVACRAGPTQIGRVLAHALAETGRAPVAALVYVGDCCEEPPDPLLARASELGMLGTRVFAFQEGGDPAAEEVLRGAARLSGGSWARFDPASPSALRRLLSAVAAYAAGGPRALEDYHRRLGERVLALAPPGAPDSG